MTDEKYKYLFPFEHISQGARIFIYGAGAMGVEYFRQLSLTKYCAVIGYIDREWERFSGSIPTVYSLQDAMKMDFDYIVIAIKISSRANLIKDELVDFGIPADKLVYISPRVEVDAFIKKDKKNDSLYDFAYKKSRCSVLIRLGNGLGSAIIKKKIFEEIVRIIPAACVDIYSMLKVEDIEALYGFESNMNLAIHEAGEEYERNKYKYALSMRISTSIIIDHVDYDVLNKYSPKGSKIIRDLEIYSKTDAGSDYRFLSYMHVMRNIYKEKNCYTAYDCDGLLDIRNMRVRMKLNRDWKAKFDKLGLKRYITINYGNGQTMEKEEAVSKQWPYEYFCQLVGGLHKQFPGVCIVQIGAKNARIVEGVDKQIIGKNMEIVKYVLNNSLLHIDIEGGLVHLASQFGTKCVVLFGPTPIEFFGYPQNINIRAGKCHGCIGLYENGYVCARGMEKPECIHSITVDGVLEEIVGSGIINDSKKRKTKPPLGRGLGD